jgi:sigma-B regulation protein RsbU (phosphoserine phosphatase)
MKQPNENCLAKPQGDVFRNILDSVSDGVTVIGRDLKIQYQNKAVLKLFGAWVGEYCFKAYRKLDSPCEDCIILEVLKDGRERRGVRDIPMPDGGVSLVEISSAAIRNTAGKIIGAAEVARDVTQQKKAEALLSKTLLKSNAVLQKLNRELSDAAGYVKTVLPQKIRSGAVQTDWQFIPSKSLGGDSFGYHWIDPDHFAIYLVDVSGHGWAAALLSVSVINVLRSQSLPDTDFHDPAQVLFALNNTFPSERNNDMFFSIWYGLYCLSSQQLVYSSGGHPPALMFSDIASPEARVEKLRTPNFIVGGEPDTVYRSGIYKLHSPGRLFVFSDGVFDIARSDGSIWGLNRFVEFMEQRYRPGQSTLDTLLDHVQTLSSRDTLEDDFSIMEIVFA